MNSHFQSSSYPASILYLLTTSKSLVLVRGQLGYLANHGFNVSVASSFDSADHFSHVDAGVRAFNVPFRRNPSLLADLRSLWTTMSLIRKVRPTIINASTPKAGFIGILAAFILRVPVRVYVVRGLRFETMTGKGRVLFTAIERLTMRLATTVLFNSTSLRNLAHDSAVIGHSRGLVLTPGSGNGIDIHRFQDLPNPSQARTALGIPRHATVLGYVGRLVHDKGIEDLALTWPQLCSERPDLWLLLVGDYEAGDPVSQSVKQQFSRDPRVTLVSWMDDPRLAYRAMDLLVFPSYREGLPNVPLEAQLCGVPVVAYAATGTVDALANGVGGMLTPVGDVEHLRNCLTTVLDDEDLRKSFGQRGHGWVAENFAQEQIWSQLLSLYRSCLGRKTP